jgi:hypothetical protein
MGTSKQMLAYLLKSVCKACPHASLLISAFVDRSPSIGMKLFDIGAFLSKLYHGIFSPEHFLQMLQTFVAAYPNKKCVIKSVSDGQFPQIWETSHNVFCSRAFTYEEFKKDNGRKVEKRQPIGVRSLMSKQQPQVFNLMKTKMKADQ